MLLEPVEQRHLLKKPSSRARHILVLKWIFTGTLLALMYRSVLLATLVSVEYEKQIGILKQLLGPDGGTCVVSIYLDRHS